MAKLYAGGQIRTLRTARNLTQADAAVLVGISPSYLNQLENDQRPLTATVLLQLTSAFGVDASFFSGDAERETAAALSELLPGIAQHELEEFARHFPTLAERVRTIPERLNEQAPNPYEYARSFFQEHSNYFHSLDSAAETLAEHLGGRQLRLTRLASVLDRDFGYTVRFNQPVESGRSDIDTTTREIRLRSGLSEAQQCFELSYRYSNLAHGDVISELIARIDDTPARNVTTHGLAQYFAAAVTMPYSEILQAACRISE